MFKVDVESLKMSFKYFIGLSVRPSEL